MAAAVGKAVINAAPYVLDAIKETINIVGNHKDRVAAMRDLDEQTAKHEAAINVLKSWFASRGIALPKAGSGIIQEIGKFIDGVSAAWAEGKIKTKQKKLTELIAYHRILAEEKRIIESGRAIAGAGMALKKAGCGAGQQLLVTVDTPNASGSGRRMMQKRTIVPH